MKHRFKNTYLFLHYIFCGNKGGTHLVQSCTFENGVSPRPVLETERSFIDNTAMKGLNETGSPIFVLLCVLYFQGQLQRCHMKGLNDIDSPIFVFLCILYFQGQLHCCLMKGLNDIDSLIFVFF